jgi:serine phosphatase RsbU (regulator of sigma subunit)
MRRPRMAAVSKHQGAHAMSVVSATSFAPAADTVPVLLYVEGAEQRTISLERVPFSIGRKTDKDLVIPDSRVSRDHAQIVYEDGAYFLVDQNSRHGTFINGIRRERQKLQRNDRIDFGARDAAYVIFYPDRPHSSAAAEFLSQISMIPSTTGSSDLEKLRLFLEAARKLNTTGVVSDVLITLLDSTLKLTKAERGYVFLRGSDGIMRLAAGRNAKGEQLLDDSTVSKSIIEEAASAASEFMVSDTSSSSDLAGRNSIIAYDLRTVIAMPLRRTQTQFAEETKQDKNRGPQVRGVLYLDSRFASRDISAVSNDILRAIATEAAALVENAHLVQAEEAARRYQQELTIAASIQQRLMTVSIPDVPFAAIRATNLACKDVGGDFFDVVMTEKGLAVLVADVSGKGISAALLASILQGMIYSQLIANMPLDEIVSTANAFLCRKVMGQKYATVLLCRLTPDGEMEYVNCGHVPPVLVSSGGITRPKDSNVPVGLLAGAEFTCAKIKLTAGARFVMVTDGVTEAEDGNGEFYGDERLEESANSDAPFDTIFSSVKTFCGDTPLGDDCTILELNFKG